MSDVLELNSVFPQVAADFEAALADIRPSAEPRLIVLDESPDARVAGLLPDWRQWREGNDSQVLLTVAANITSLDGPLTDGVGIMVQAAGLLQDFVMDMLGTPWPVLSGAAGSGVAVPEVRAGEAVWSAGGLVPVPFGQLRFAISP